MRILLPIALLLTAGTAQPSSYYLYSTAHHAAFDKGAMPVRWGGLTGQTATVKEVIANNKMVIRGTATKPGLTIARFEVFFFTNELPKNERLVKIEGNCLDKQTIGLINQLKPGDRIMFSNIALVDANNTAQYADDFAIDIK